MNVSWLTAALVLVNLSLNAQNRPTEQWSYTIPFTNPSVTMPLSFLRNEKSDNHILEWQSSGVLPSFWYHSKSRFGLDIGVTFINYSSYDVFFAKWLDDNVNGIYHPYYSYNNDYNFHGNVLLTYYVVSAHTWNFHAFAGYCRKFFRWRIPAGIYGNHGGVVVIYSSGNTYATHENLYRISAQQMNANYHLRAGISAVHNGFKRLVVLKCWYDLQPPARIEYRIEEISPNGGLDIRESRRLDWFASVGLGVEIHGFIKSKKEHSTP